MQDPRTAKREASKRSWKQSWCTCLLTVDGWQVITHPYFEGKEEVLALAEECEQFGSHAVICVIWVFQVYLRAQIARITADTMICPKGFLYKELWKLEAIQCTLKHSRLVHGSSSRKKKIHQLSRTRSSNARLLSNCWKRRRQGMTIWTQIDSSFFLFCFCFISENCVASCFLRDSKQAWTHMQSAPQIWRLLSFDPNLIRNSSGLTFCWMDAQSTKKFQRATQRTK